MQAGKEHRKNVPMVSLEDFRQAGANSVGTPTRLENVSAQLKNQIRFTFHRLVKRRIGGKTGRHF